MNGGKTKPIWSFSRQRNDKYSSTQLHCKTLWNNKTGCFCDLLKDPAFNIKAIMYNVWPNIPQSSLEIVKDKRYCYFQFSLGLQYQFSCSPPGLKQPAVKSKYLFLVCEQRNVNEHVIWSCQLSVQYLTSIQNLLVGIAKNMVRCFLLRNLTAENQASYN